MKTTKLDCCSWIDKVLHSLGHSRGQPEADLIIGLYAVFNGCD